MAEIEVVCTTIYICKQQASGGYKGGKGSEEMTYLPGTAV
jgi:hypothetical protein